MDRAELDLLLDPRVLAAVDEEAAPATPGDVLARSTALRRAGFAPATTAAILTQARLRRRARGKFGDFAERMLFTRAGLEQATRLAVAAHHAGRIERSGLRRVGDLGCGIGGDSLAFAAVELAVLAVDSDPVTATIAQYNLAPFPEVEVRVAEADDVDPTTVDAVWLDPARRTAGHDETRRSAPAAHSPSLDLVRAVAARVPAGVKLSPAHDRDDLPGDGEAQWVSHRGDVVELVLWTGALARPGIGRAALVLGEEGAAELTAAADTADEPVGPIGRYVHEPDGAVIRARLIGDLARATSTRPLGPGIAYLSGDGAVDSPFLASFEVDAVLPFDRQAIRRELAARRIGRLEIKKRGVDLDPARFRTALRLSGDEEAVLIVTRTADRRSALLCRRLRRTPAGAGSTSAS